MPGGRNHRVWLLAGLTAAAISLLCWRLWSNGDAEERTWGVVVSGLPDRVAAELADEDVPLYILKQTHEPLLRSDDGQNYTSRVLHSWGRTADSSSFTFCVDGRSGFDENRVFSAADLERHIEFLAVKDSRRFRLSRAGSCVTVCFDNGNSGYLQYLSLYENSPTLNIGGKIELGLGQYRASLVSNDRIELKRKQRVGNGYNKIVFYEASADPELDLVREDIADINRISWKELPDSARKRLKPFESIPLASSGLVLVTPDRAARKLVYECLDIKRFRAAVYPQKTGVHDIQNILPIGVPGGRPGKPSQQCGAAGTGFKGGRLTLGVVDRGNEAPLKEYARDFYKKTGVVLNVKLYGAADLVSTLFSRPHPYDMVPIMYSVVQAEYETFLKDFSVRDGFLDYDVPKVAELRAALLKENDAQARAALVERAMEELKKEYVVIPLFQDVKTFYYPAEIKNLTIGKGFSEYPDIADFRL